MRTASNAHEALNASAQRNVRFPASAHGLQFILGVFTSGMSGIGIRKRSFVSGSLPVWVLSVERGAVSMGPLGVSGRGVVARRAAGRSKSEHVDLI